MMVLFSQEGFYFSLFLSLPVEALPWGERCRSQRWSLVTEREKKGHICVEHRVLIFICFPVCFITTIQ